MTKKTLSLVGRCRKPHGLKGEVKVESFTDPISKILDYSPWHLESGSTVTVKASRAVSKGLLVVFEGHETIDSVQSFRNLYIHADLPVLSKDDGFYWRDLTGMSVFDPDNVHLGTVEGLTSTHQQDLMIVKKNNKVIYVPFSIPDVVKNVDTEKKEIKIAWYEENFND